MTALRIRVPLALPVFCKYRTHLKLHWKSQWYPTVEISRDEARGSQVWGFIDPRAELGIKRALF